MRAGKPQVTDLQVAGPHIPPIKVRRPWTETLAFRWKTRACLGGQFTGRLGLGAGVIGQRVQIAMMWHSLVAVDFGGSGCLRRKEDQPILGQRALQRKQAADCVTLPLVISESGAQIGRSALDSEELDGWREA